MEPDFINLTEENLAEEHLCCIIRSKKPHPGVEAKRQWLAARLKEGHVFRKLDAKAVVFIEYAPLETAWVPVLGGVCMLGAKKQKAWLSDQAFAKKFGFEAVDTAGDEYELLALSFDGTVPQFAPNAKKLAIESPELTICYSMQCPFIPQRVEAVRRYCEERGVPLSLIPVDTLQKAKELPCVFNNWAVFYGGRFVTVNQLDAAGIERILKKGS